MINKKIINYFFVFIIVLLLPLSSQTNKNNDKTKLKKKSAQEIDLGFKNQDITEESNFVYDPGGRRDPFWDMLKGKTFKNVREAKEGIEGIMIDELDLEGMVYIKGKYAALCRGPNNKAYIIKEGDMLYDGEVVSITSKKMVFRKHLTIALGGKRYKLIEKILNPEKEDLKSDNVNKNPEKEGLKKNEN